MGKNETPLVQIKENKMNIFATIGILIFLWYLYYSTKRLPFKPAWMADKKSSGHLLMWAILIISIIIFFYNN